MTKTAAKSPHTGLVSRRTVAEFFGVTLAGVDYWRSCGCPSSPRGLKLADVAKWLVQQRRMKDVPPKRAPTQIDVDADPLLSGESPALERYRTARAELVELELAKKRGELASVDKILEFENFMISQVRHATDQLVRKFGNEGFDYWNDCCDLMEKRLLQWQNDISEGQLDDDDTADETEEPGAIPARSRGRARSRSVRD